MVRWSLFATAALVGLGCRASETAASDGQRAAPVDDTASVTGATVAAPETPSATPASSTAASSATPSSAEERAAEMRTMSSEPMKSEPLQSPAPSTRGGTLSSVGSDLLDLPTDASGASAPIQQGPRSSPVVGTDGGTSLDTTVPSRFPETTFGGVTSEGADRSFPESSFGP